MDIDFLSDIWNLKGLKYLLFVEMDECNHFSRKKMVGLFLFVFCLFSYLINSN